MTKKHVIIIGAGPAGLFSAFKLLRSNFQVTLIEKTSGAGKKFLIAGHSGLNLTHSEDLQSFLSRYSPSPSLITRAVERLPPEEIKKFYENELKTKLFTGSTGHVFPVEMKAGKVLLNWMSLLNNFSDFEFIKYTKLSKIIDKETIELTKGNTSRSIKANFFIYALGGASWSKTGSSGDWIDIFKEKKVDIIDFRPENCGHEVSWSQFFKENIEALPLKNINMTLRDKTLRGEVMITSYGIEGQLIYKMTHLLSSDYKNSETPELQLDLLPDQSIDKVIQKIEKMGRKTSLSTKLKKGFKFSKGQILLMNEFRDLVDLSRPQELAKLLKSIPIKLSSARPIDEAISTSGGVSLDSVTENFELHSLNNHFCVGEMLDWSAPTGGYLLSACFATANSACEEIIKRN